MLDEKRNKSLNRRLDLRIIPLCCWLYLLNFLDRGNIGNARILNKETGDDLMSKTGMTPQGYAITLTLFSVAYAVFEVPSNWVMKHYVRPSVWLAFLLYVRHLTTIAAVSRKQFWRNADINKWLLGSCDSGVCWCSELSNSVSLEVANWSGKCGRDSLNTSHLKTRCLSAHHINIS